MAKTRVRLNIMGVDYIVASEEDSENYIRSIAAEVESRMSAVLEENPRVSAMMAAVLCALDYCDEAKKANGSADNLRTQIKDYLEDSSKARMEADEARRENERLKKEIQTLRMRLAESGTPAARAPKAVAPADQAAQTGDGAVGATDQAAAQAAPMSRPKSGRMFTTPEPLSGVPEAADVDDQGALHFFEGQQNGREDEKGGE